MATCQMIISSFHFFCEKKFNKRFRPTLELALLSLAFFDKRSNLKINLSVVSNVVFFFHKAQKVEESRRKFVRRHDPQACLPDMIP